MGEKRRGVLMERPLPMQSLEQQHGTISNDSEAW